MASFILVSCIEVIFIEAALKCIFQPCVNSGTAMSSDVL